jgi:CMP-N-acetylneuraminic acid synthetase
VIGVSKLEHHHPMRIKKIVGDRIEEFGPVEQIGARRQDLQPEAYIRNGSIFAMQRNRLIKDGLRYGHEDSRPLIMPESKSIDIDTMNELKLAELILNDKYENRIRELKNKS